jgi:hypothetical protein
MEEFREDAAIKGITKLQARQRGAQDRQRVHVDKAQGNLPGQKRSVPQFHLSEAHAQESPKADNVLEDLTAEDIENRKKAALKIQTIQRGRQTRKVLAENDLEAARIIFAERNMMHDLHMDADVLARSSAGQQLEENNANNMNKYALEQAKQVALQHQHEDEVAAVRMQSLYRGFRDRKQIRGKRESAELSQRHKASANVVEQAEEAKKVYDQQTSYTAGGIERSYLTSSRKEKQTPARRAAGQSSAAPKAVLAPTLVDKKACMTMLQKKACIMLEEQVSSEHTTACVCMCIILSLYTCVLTAYYCIYIYTDPALGYLVRALRRACARYSKLSLSL